MPPENESDWARLGRLLADRRIQLGTRYRNKALFSRERDINRRMLWSIESGARDTYTPDTRRAIEASYMLAPGSLDRVLAGGDLEPLSLRAVPDHPLASDDPEIAALIRDWPELETIWALTEADGKPYPREERIRLMRAHIDTIRRKVRELEIRAERALRARPAT